MSIMGHSDFIKEELDQKLLSTQFKVSTNWHVITGAPSSGKTTLIKLIKDKGFKISAEPARQYIEMELAKGLTIPEVQKDLVELNKAIAAFHLGIERQLPANDTIFLDRGLPDCLAYHRLHGMNPNELLDDCFHFRYRSVFILERLPFQQDGVRYEDDECAEFHQFWLLKDYRAMGYNPIFVPILSPEERLKFILDKLSKYKLI